MEEQEIQKNLKSGDIRDAAEMLGISYEAAKKTWQRKKGKNYDILLSALNIIVTQRLRRLKNEKTIN